MRRELTIGLVQMGAVERDLDATLTKARGLVQKARSDGAELIVLPEFFSREYFCQYHDNSYNAYAESDDGPSASAVSSWAAEFGVPIVAGIYEKQAPGLLFDTTFFFDETGAIRARYRKTHPAAVRSLEKLYFRGGLDFPVVELAGWRVGAVICYDLWFPEAARSVALNGAELIVAPFATWDEPMWPEFIRCRAFENGVYFAAVNKAGREGEWQMQGRSTVSDPRGEVIVECARDVDDVRVAILDRDLLDVVRTEFPMYRDRRPHIYTRVVTE